MLFNKSIRENGEVLCDTAPGARDGAAASAWFLARGAGRCSWCYVDFSL